MYKFSDLSMDEIFIILWEDKHAQVVESALDYFNIYPVCFFRLNAKNKLYVILGSS